MAQLIPFSEAFTIIRPEDYESCYKFLVKNNLTSQKSLAWLTYELVPGNAPDRAQRNLLLCDNDSLLSYGDRAQFERLATLLKTKRDRRLGTAKTIVNALVEDDPALRTALPGVCVAVHKFGPVPALMIDPSVEVKVHGSSVSCRIVLFPKQDPQQDLLLPMRHSPSFTSTKSEFRKCMRIAPEVVFRRYFEDAAEDLHDLRRALSISRLLRRAKSTETLLSESIGSKIRAFVPKASISTSSNPEDQEAWSFFQQNSKILYEAQVVYNFAFFLLNEMYRFTGIFPQEHYWSTIRHTHSQFEALLGTSLVTELRIKSSVLQFIDECQKAYFPQGVLESGISRVKALHLLSKNAPQPWCEELAKFAEFTAILRYLASPRGRPIRIFLSHHPKVESSKQIRDEITTFLKQKFEGRVTTLFLEDIQRDDSFRRIVRSAIWMAKGTISICPADTRGITDALDKEYKWLAREAEHSLLLKRQTFLGAQQGANVEKILSDVQDPTLRYLVTGSKLPPNAVRASELSNHFSEWLRRPFRAQISGDLVGTEADQNLSAFVDELRFENLESQLNGYLNQFSRETQNTLIFFLERLGPYGKKSKRWMVRELAAFRLINRKADMAFRNFWIQLRNRRLDVGRGGRSLIGFSDKLGYYENLSTLIRFYIPGMDRRMRNAWRTQWLYQWGRKLREVRH